MANFGSLALECPLVADLVRLLLERGWGGQRGGGGLSGQKEA